MTEHLIHNYGLFWREAELYWGEGSNKVALLGVAARRRTLIPRTSAGRHEPCVGQNSQSRGRVTSRTPHSIHSGPSNIPGGGTVTTR